MLALLPPAPRIEPQIELPAAWTSEWRVLQEGKPVGTARETWRLAPDESGTTAFVQTFDAVGARPKAVADRQAALGPGAVPIREVLTVSSSAGKATYTATLGPKVAELKVVAPRSKASYELEAPAGVPRGALTPRTVARLAGTKAPTKLAVFEPQKARWTVMSVAPGKRMGKDVLVRLTDDRGVTCDYAFDASYRARVVQFSTGVRFERTTIRED